MLPRRINSIKLVYSQPVWHSWPLSGKGLLAFYNRLAVRKTP
jgi:hypothetical protein